MLKCAQAMSVTLAANHKGTFDPRFACHASAVILWGPKCDHISLVTKVRGLGALVSKVECLDR